MPPSGGGCWFAQLEDAGPCDGRMDRCHLIPKQRISRELRREVPTPVLAEIVWHPTVWRWGCRRHHGQFDGGALRISRAQVPDDVEKFARVWGLEWSLDHDYGRAHVDGSA